MVIYIYKEKEYYVSKETLQINEYMNGMKMLQKETQMLTRMESSAISLLNKIRIKY